MKIECYKGRDDQWYWRKRARNGNIVEDGSEGYSTKWSLKRAIKRKLARTAAPLPTVVWLDV